MNTEPKVVTLANLAECTAQEVFDHVAFRLKQQDFRRSIDDEGSCLYRNPEGLACAAGHCMSDEEYARLGAIQIENEPWFDLSNEGFVPITHATLIGQLQNAHDGGTNADLMVKQLKKAAKLHILSDAILGS